MLIRQTAAPESFHKVSVANDNTFTYNNDEGIRPFPQAYKDVSSDRRKGWSSLFAYGKRKSERDAFVQAHTTPSGTPGVLKLAVMDNKNQPIPFAPFEWNGRQMLTDAQGIVKFVEKDYFQTVSSLENERVKYVNAMTALVVGQPSENVVSIFGTEFYRALAGSDENDADWYFTIGLYRSYLETAGIDPYLIERKVKVFSRYAGAECSPEVMCAYGDNDPEWAKAFNKLSMLCEYVPSAILWDEGTLNPLESSGRVHGDKGDHNPGPPDADVQRGMMNQTLNGLRGTHRDSNVARATPGTTRVGGAVPTGNSLAAGGFL